MALIFAVVIVYIQFSHLYLMTKILNPDFSSGRVTQTPSIQTLDPRTKLNSSLELKSEFKDENKLSTQESAGIQDLPVSENPSEKRLTKILKKRVCIDPCVTYSVPVGTILSIFGPVC